MAKFALLKDKRTEVNEYDIYELDSFWKKT